MADFSRGMRTDAAAGARPFRGHNLRVNGLRGHLPQRRAPWPDQARVRCVPLHRAIVAVDIANSATRANPAKGELRRRMYSLLDEALRISGITEHLHDPAIDRGDGALILIHPADQAPKTLLLNTFIPMLHQLLADHNAHHAGQAFQLRAAVHAGEVHYDQWGQFGEALDLTCRLLDAPELKQVLVNTPVPLALVVSDDIYRSIIKHGYDDINDRDFNPIVQVEVAGLSYSGWVQTNWRFNHHSVRP